MKRRNFYNLHFRKWLRKRVKKSEMVKYNEIPFALRKREFLSNVCGIVSYLEKVQQKDGRKCMLLYITSQEWTHREIKEIIYYSQKCFADICIYTDNDTIDKNEMYRFFFEEYGLRLEYVNQSQVMIQRMYDTVIYLTKTWDDVTKELVCQNAYVVCEVEGEIKRSRKKIHIDSSGEVMKICVDKKQDWYSGFVYTCDGEQLTYADALLLLYGEHEAASQKANAVEKAISVVAIYSIE